MLPNQSDTAARLAACLRQQSETNEIRLTPENAADLAAVLESLAEQWAVPLAYQSASGE